MDNCAILRNIRPKLVQLQQGGFEPEKADVIQPAGVRPGHDGRRTEEYGPTQADSGPVHPSPSATSYGGTDVRVPEGTAHRRRRPRTFTSEQLIVLEKQFDRDHYLNMKTRNKLASEIGVEKERIMVWFQNKRSRIRKQQMKLRKEQQAHSLDGGVPTNTSLGVPSSASVGRPSSPVAPASPALSALHMPAMMPDGHSRGMARESLWSVDHLLHGDHSYREQWQLRVQTGSSVTVGMNYWQQPTLYQSQLKIE